MKPHQTPTGGVLISHPVHQHAYETAVAAQDAGNLRWFATGLYDTGRGLADPRLRTWLPGGIRRRIERELRRRRHPNSILPAFSRFQATTLWARALGGPSGNSHTSDASIRRSGRIIGSTTNSARDWQSFPASTWSTPSRAPHWPPSEPQTVPEKGPFWMCRAPTNGSWMLQARAPSRESRRNACSQTFSSRPLTTSLRAWSRPGYLSTASSRSPTASIPKTFKRAAASAPTTCSASCSSAELAVARACRT